MRASGHTCPTAWCTPTLKSGCCVQANLGLRRAAQCERCLGLASMLAMKEPNMTTNTMRSQLSRLYGQLYALQVC